MAPAPSLPQRISLNFEPLSYTFPPMKTSITLILLAVSFLFAACQDMAIVHYNKGIDAMEQDDPTDAVDNFEKSLTYRKDDPDTHLNLGVAYYSVGDYDSALEHLKIALDSYPADPILHYGLGETYAAMGLHQGPA
jgi:tetratricopeptide (TPR) repeat protein